MSTGTGKPFDLITFLGLCWMWIEVERLKSLIDGGHRPRWVVTNAITHESLPDEYQAHEDRRRARIARTRAMLKP